MHLLVRETHGLDEAAPAADLGLSPAPLLLLSFSDSDLGAAATAWDGMDPAGRPGLRLANLARLAHPMSVDLLADGIAAEARCIVVRLLGGLEYWRYGAEELAGLCRGAGIALALLPGDGRDDSRLRALSAVPGEAWDRLDALFTAGGPANAASALRLMAHLASLVPDDCAPVVQVPAWGEYSPPAATHPLPPPASAGGAPYFPPPASAGGPPYFPPPALAGGDAGGSLAVIVFYRSHLLAGDTAPVRTLADALAERGLQPRALFVDSLKSPATATGIANTLRNWKPRVVISLTAFSARQDDGPSPLDAPAAPVLQAMLSGASRDAWAKSAHGVSQSDLAMQVALPELDGRLLTTSIAFKEPGTLIPDLEYARTVLRPDPEGIALAADRAAGWARLAAKPRAERRIAILLPDYPGAARTEESGQEGYAVGLDGFASLSAIVRLLRDAGYDLGNAPLPDAAVLPALLLARQADGFRYHRIGKLVLAVQPDRGSPAGRRSGYHDPDQPPCDAYVAFHAWLRDQVDALVFLGTHGSLEWLPGKAVALSAACIPAALTRGVPVIYPFIVNNPGEAAMAKRRLGAVTIGHLTPPLRRAGLHGAPAELERLIDEYAAADGLDRRRTKLLRRDILERAEVCGLLAEGGATDGNEEDRLARLDAYLCDVKELQIRDGLHVFGTPPAPERRAALLQALTQSSPSAPPEALAVALDASAGTERAALLEALDGRFVPPGPAGAPSRGRADVLPTGRNLFALDPRAVPTRSAVLLAERACAELLRRHLQDHGEHPRRLVIDLWGSTTLRTGGEDLALALLLMGVRPVWDERSSRVTGIEIVPLAELDRPRVDVTLRISGLFRDAFPAQAALFGRAVQAVAARDEAAEWNPLAASFQAGEHVARVYGAAPGRYGSGIEGALARGTWEARDELGAAYLAAAAPLHGPGHARGGFAARVAAADAFVHTQDHAETDLLDSPDYAAHAGGFAAAAAMLGAAPALYHADTADPDKPRLRPLADEIARIVRGRAINADWIAGQRRHGHRGAAELARTLDSLHAFAATLPARLDRQFELYFDATLGDPAVDAFLGAVNPAAHAAMRARFAEAMARGLWRPRRNAIASTLGDAA